MDMDSSSHSHSHPNTNNWLAFSLSNNSLLFPSSGVLDQEHGSSAVLGVGPKLEDFLGGAGGETAGGFDGEAQGITGLPQVDIYGDSELRTIAASFLPGFSTEQSKQLAVAAAPHPSPPVKKAVDTFGQRTSIFRGVTRHRWTGRYEAHLWDNSCRREGQSRKGRQVYLGGYDKEEKAARAYDLAALKYWGPTTTTNFPVSDYEKEMDEMKHMTRQEFVASLRRRSSGFSRGASMYRGVTRHHQHGRWQARIGRVAGNKDLYLGTFSTQEEAAEAYDIAAIKFRGLNAVTNFDMSRYDVRSIASSNLPIGGAVNKSKTSSESDNKSSSEVVENSTNELALSQNSTTAAISFGLPMKQDQSSSLWAALGYQGPAMSGRNPTFHDSNGTPFNAAEFHYYNQQHHQSTEITTAPSCSTSTIVYNNNTGGTTGEAQGGSISNNDDGVAWIVQGASTAAAHSFEGDGKVRSLSAFQTPIFGME